MQISEDGLTFIANAEGYRATSYQDQAGIWTIGYGTTRIDGKPVTAGMRVDVPTARALLRKDAHTAEMVVEIETVPVEPFEFDALVSLTYNIGTAGYRSSTLRRAINEGRTVREDHFTRWNKVTVAGKKRESAGLTARRHREFILFSSGVYANA